MIRPIDRLIVYLNGLMSASPLQLYNKTQENIKIIVLASFSQNMNIDVKNDKIRNWQHDASWIWSRMKSLSSL